MSTPFKINEFRYPRAESAIGSYGRRCLSSKSDADDNDSTTTKQSLDQKEQPNDDETDDEPRRPDEPRIFFESIEEQQTEKEAQALKDAATTAENILDKSLFTEVVKIRMPDMGEGDGKILEWYKQEGELIRRDEALCLIETEDFSFDMITEDETDAIVGEILVPAGSTARDEQVICILLHPKPPSPAPTTTEKGDSKPDAEPLAAESKP